MSYYPAGSSNYYLSSSIGSSDTTITLTSFLEPVSSTPYTMALFNSSIMYATIAPKTSQSEFISFTGITQNSNGTATLTGVTRGLQKKYPYTASSTFQLPHPGQSIFILSDAPQVFNSYVAKDNDSTMTAYLKGLTPLASTDFATKAYVDGIVSGGTITNDKVVTAGIAGETVAAGNLVYLKAVDGRWWKASATTEATCRDVQLGIAQGSGTAGNNITGGVLQKGVDTNNTGTAGNFAYVSNTAGTVGTSAGTIPRVIGQYETSLLGLYFNPDYQYIPTSYAVDSVGTDSYAVTLPNAYNAYYPGMAVQFKAGTANTGACSLNVNGLGAKTIKKNTSSDTVTGDILQNQVVTVVYDGTNFQLTSNLSQQAGFFGDGSDGSATISSPTTLTRDMYYQDLTITSTLNTGNWRVFVNGTLSGNGTIAANGGNGGAGGTPTAGTAGAGITGYFTTPSGGAGGVGGSGAGYGGVAGTTGTNANPGLGVAAPAGVAGGSCTGVPATGATPSGTLTAPLCKVGVLAWQTLSGLDVGSSGTPVRYAGSAGTGGGTSGSSNTAGATATSGGGGGGGGTGGIVFIVARSWTGTFTISATGGNGGAGGAGVQTGAGSAGGGAGGSGGSGGVALVVYGSKTWTGSYALSGGTGGVGGTGVNGGSTPTTANTGITGVSYEFIYSQLTR